MARPSSKSAFVDSALTHGMMSSWDAHDEQEPIKIGIVLTGGGSHGAFTAGVLSEILSTLYKFGKIVQITGTSAGACNAAVFGSGLNAAGVDEAIRRGQEFWDRIKIPNSPLGKEMRRLTDWMLPRNLQWPNIPQPLFNPFYVATQLGQSLPASLIAETIRDLIPDWQADVQNGHVGIAINAAKQSGYSTLENIILTRGNLTPDGVGASANLKTFGIHRISDTNNPKLKGCVFYDGAYCENGSLMPHLEAGVTDIIAIVLHDRRHGSLDPKLGLKHTDIHSQILQIMADDSFSVPPRIHAIEIETLEGEIGGLSHINDSSKLNADAGFIDLLYEAGKKAGQRWVIEKSHMLGVMTGYSVYPPALQTDAQKFIL
jgi:hypothetical protein